MAKPSNVIEENDCLLTTQDSANTYRRDQSTLRRGSIGSETCSVLAGELSYLIYALFLF